MFQAKTHPNSFNAWWGACETRSKISHTPACISHKSGLVETRRLIVRACSAHVCHGDIVVSFGIFESSHGSSSRYVIRLCGVFGLVCRTHGATLLGPREVDDRDNEEAVGCVGNTGQGIVPGHESCNDAKGTSGPSETGVRRAIFQDQVRTSQEEECQVQGEEEEEEGDGGLQGADKEEEGEDEPALKISQVRGEIKLDVYRSVTYHQIKSERVEQGFGVLSGLDGFFNLEPSRSENDGEGDPETTVGGQSGSTKGVANSHFP